MDSFKFQYKKYHFLDLMSKKIYNILIFVLLFTIKIQIFHFFMDFLIAIQLCNSIYLKDIVYFIFHA